MWMRRWLVAGECIDMFDARGGGGGGYKREHGERDVPRIDRGVGSAGVE